MDALEQDDIEDNIMQVFQDLKQGHEEVMENFRDREDFQEDCIKIGAQIIFKSKIFDGSDESFDEHYPMMQIMVLIGHFIIDNPELKFSEIREELWGNNWKEYFDGKDIFNSFSKKERQNFEKALQAQIAAKGKDPQTVQRANDAFAVAQKELKEAKAKEKKLMKERKENIKKFFKQIKQKESEFQDKKAKQQEELRKKHRENEKRKRETEKVRHKAIAKKEQEQKKARKNNLHCQNETEFFSLEDIEKKSAKDLTYLKFKDSIYCLDNSSYASMLKNAESGKVRGRCKNHSDEARAAGKSIKCDDFYPINIGMNIFINKTNWNKLQKQVTTPQFRDPKTWFNRKVFDKNPIKQRKLIFKNKRKVDFTTNLHIVGEKTGMGDVYDLVSGKYQLKKKVVGGNPNKKRSFSVVRLAKRNEKDKSKTEGRYIARDAIGAAKKAFNRECRQSKIKGQCTLIIILKETTQGSKKKRYVYKMKRVKLQKPIKIDRNNESITINYKTNAQRIKQLNHKEFLKRVKGAGKMSGGGKNALTGFYNIIANDVILHTDYFMYPEIRSENGVYKDIMKRHKKEFKKSGIKNISIELHEVMLYPKSEGITAIKEAMDSQLPHVRESMNMLNKDEVQERQKDAFDFSNISKMLDNL